MALWQDVRDDVVDILDNLISDMGDLKTMLEGLSDCPDTDTYNEVSSKLQLYTNNVNSCYMWWKMITPSS